MKSLTNPDNGTLSRAGVYLGACTLFAGTLLSQCQYSPTDLQLPDTSYPAGSYNSGTTTFEATHSITAAGSSGNLIVGGSASVTFQAGSLVDLKPGFQAAGSGGARFDAKIGSVAQYQLTTASNPTAGGTITLSPCTPNGNGYYSAGTVVVLTANASSGYKFVNWSTGGTTDPLFVTMSSNQNLTANFAPAAPPLVLPTGLKGLEYFPRGHAWWSMLYDWYSLDCSTTTLPQSACAPNMYVYQIVQNDLQMLKANGINFIHLYLWDQDIVGAGTSGPGFVGWDDGGPQISPGNPLGPNDSSHNQWTALNAFVSMAQSNGIWLNLEFAVSRPANEAPTHGYSTTGTNYGSWVNQFIGAVQGYHNVLIWGLDYGISGPSGQDWGAFWANAYPAILSQVQNNPYPSGRPLLMVGSNFGAVWPTYPDVQSISSLQSWPYQCTINGMVYGPYSYTGYQWTSANGGPCWLQPQQTPSLWWQNAIVVPDLYSFQMYNASAADLEAALNSLASTIPFSKMIVTEVATGSSIESNLIGNGLAAAIDAQTPTTNAAGQAQWLTDTLCVFSRHGIPAFGWYGLYDSASWWESNQNQSGGKLAGDGYWGLISEYGANKAAWTAMLNYPANCPAGYLPPAPVIALYADATYYTQGDTGIINYTAAGVTSLSLNETPVPGIYSCETADQISPSSNLAGSCSSLNVTMTNITSQITLSGVNTDVAGSQSGYQSSGSASINVTVGPSPIISGITDYTNGQSCNLSQHPSCTITASQNDILEIYGLGFSPFGGNTIELDGSSGPWYLYNQDGYYFWDASRTQMNAQIACYLPPGLWTFKVHNPNSGAPSMGYSVNVISSPSCQ